ncbi:MAG: ABC transporter substrate-binding protein, partial [Mesorhizobium sp.]
MKLIEHKISRRGLMKAGIAAGTALSIPSVLRAQTPTADARRVRMVIGGLSAFDPVVATSDPTNMHAYA